MKEKRAEETNAKKKGEIGKREKFILNLILKQIGVVFESLQITLSNI